MSRNIRLGLLGVVLVVAGAFNNVTGKIRSKPLGAYDYFVSLANSVVYSVVYLIVLVFRLKSNPTTIKRNLKFIFSNNNPSNAGAPTEGTCRVRAFCGSVASAWGYIGPWKLMIVAGLCDSLGNILGFIAQPYVAGSIYSLMSQFVVLFTALVSMILLGSRYTLWQVLSVGVVAAGAIYALVPELTPVVEGDMGGSCGFAGGCGAHAASRTHRDTMFFASMVAVSTLPTAISFVVKEMVFTQYRKQQTRVNSSGAPPLDTEPPSPLHDARSSLMLHYNGESPTQASNVAGNTFAGATGTGAMTPHVMVAQAEVGSGVEEMDIFVVAAISSLMQIAFVPLALPLNRLSGHVHGESTLRYFKDGLLCLAGITPDSCTIEQANCTEWKCCYYAPPAYTAYIISNLAYNTSILGVLRMASALFSFVCLKAVLPASIVLFVIFPWPLLSEEDIGVSSVVVISLVVIVVGIVLFNMTTNQGKRLVAQGYFLNSQGQPKAQPDCLWPLRLCGGRRRRSLTTVTVSVAGR